MNPFHPGELAVQERAGMRDMAARVGQGIRDLWPDAARDFVRQQSLAFLGGADETGALWTTPLAGEGFMSVVGNSLRLDAVRLAAPLDADPLWRALGNGAAPVGLIALDLSTRRRLRANGMGHRSGDIVEIVGEQVYSNCPKYIQERHVLPVAAPVVAVAPIESDVLDEAAALFVARADTFFIATASPGNGADCSHRGGNPGFVRAGDDRTLVWRDFPGNAMFQTLGNLELDPRAGLAFLDFASGALLQLSGEARTVWHGTDRTVRFTLRRALWSPHFTPMRWGFGAYSPFNPANG